MEFNEFLNLTEQLVDESGSTKWKEEAGCGWKKVFKVGKFFGEATIMGDKPMAMSGLFAPATEEGVRVMTLERSAYQVPRVSASPYPLPHLLPPLPARHLMTDLLLGPVCDGARL